MLGKYRNTLFSILEAVIPEGKKFPKGNSDDVERIEQFAKQNKVFGIILKILLFTIEETEKISSKPINKRIEILKKWQKGGIIRRAIVEIILAIIKFSHFYEKNVYENFGCVWDKAPKFYQKPRYMIQVKTADQFSEDIECEAVVVGSGAGGGVVAKELTDKGIAVVIVEEGKYFTREHFNGQAIEAFRKFYSPIHRMIAFGNGVFVIPSGKLVGGSTAINTGTCWRTPEWILERWEKELGLRELSPKNMEKYFEKVENIIRVQEASDRVIGGIKEVISRGCKPLGFRHYPLKRNAPDCDAQGVCNFGCPTDARLSTNISYIPKALERGAILLEKTKLERIIIENDKAKGVIVSSNGKKIKINSKVVIISCGSIMTPVVLMKNKINPSGQVGKNLTIHPSLNVGAFFENDIIDPHKHAPQAYCIDSLHREGILFLHAGLQPDAGAVAIPYIGEMFSKIMSEYEKTAWFGVLVEDRPSGIVKALGDNPMIFYWLGKREIELLKKGIVIMAKIFLYAGAKYVFPPIRGIDDIKSFAELESLSTKSLSATDFKIIVGFHPLGTCRMGIDPRNSVVDQNHKVHGIDNLFVCDGSVVPTSIGVNPQETIMALATRAAEKIAEVIT